MRPFHSQIRLAKWAVDTAQSRLGELLRLEEQLREGLRGLEAELSAEQQAASASLEARVTYGAYAVQLNERRNRLKQSIIEAQEQTATARDALRDAFAELKKFELAAEAAEDRAKRRQDQRDQTAMDEIGLTIFRRQDPGS